MFLLELAWRDLRHGSRHLRIFAACLLLGVALVAAGGGLYRQVTGALQTEARALFGGDVEVESPRPLPGPALDWLQAQGPRSRLIELRTMMRSGDGSAQLIELQSADAAYPLVGKVELAPAGPLADALAVRADRWGAAVDAALATRMGLRVGDTVSIGDLDLEVRALIVRQPDRSLRADWAGAPVLVAEGALAATGLVQPLSRVEYRYRALTDRPVADWRRDFYAAFPDLDAEVRGLDQRNERMAEVLGQIGSGLLLIGFSALFIGGLGVFNSVRAYLDGKLGTLATLRAIGLRDARLAGFVLLQVLMLALLASAAGVLVGNALALGGALLASERLPLGGLTGLLAPLVLPSLVAMAFGVLTALVFALPALGRALTVSPAALFRGLDGAVLHTPRRAVVATATLGALIVGALVAALPDARFGLAFVLASVALLALLEGITRGLRRLAARALQGADLTLSVRLALSGLQRAGSPLRSALLSLGAALSLLVACTLVVATLLRAVNDTVPQNAPALVFYDVQTEQIGPLRETLQTLPSLRDVTTAPLVLGRLGNVNGEVLRESGDDERASEARDEQKLSTRAGNVDDVVIRDGAWWPDDHRGPPLVAMEDREADELGLKVGDRLVFQIQGQPLEATLVAIYSQRRMQARLWLEAIFSDGALDPFITRHVGAAWLDATEALTAQDRVAALAPNIATVRTESLLRETRGLMGQASAGLLVIALTCLAASLLVLASVVAGSRTRQLYDATVMHAVGARHGTLRAVLLWEYGLLALVTTVFATLAGSALAAGLLHWRLQLDPGGLYAAGLATAALVSTVSLGLGARHLLAQMRLNPAMLLRGG
ncbi:ABC transporter permease [Hydrogenophaga sp. XSHU_21]